MLNFLDNLLKKLVIMNLAHDILIFFLNFLNIMIRDTVISFFFILVHNG